MKLLKQHQKAIDAVKPFIEKGEFYLAGGTAVYYYLKHRHSLDLDFFTKKDFDLLQGEYNFNSQTILFRSKGTIHSEIEGVKVSFIQYCYDLLKPPNLLNDIPIAQLEDILCMKMNAIINRGSRKDFADVYFIMRELSLTKEKCIELFLSKFGSYNPLIIHKAMTYFTDADNEPEIKMVKPVKWEDMKKFFIRTFARL